MIAGRHKSGKYVGWVIRTILSYSLRVRGYFRRLKGQPLEFIMELSPWPGGFFNSGHNSPLERTIWNTYRSFSSKQSRKDRSIDTSFHKTGLLPGSNYWILSWLPKEFLIFFPKTFEGWSKRLLLFHIQPAFRWSWVPWPKWTWTCKCCKGRTWTFQEFVRRSVSVTGRNRSKRSSTGPFRYSCTLKACNLCASVLITLRPGSFRCWIWIPKGLHKWGLIFGFSQCFQPITYRQRSIFTLVFSQTQSCPRWLHVWWFSQLLSRSQFLCWHGTWGKDQKLTEIRLIAIAKVWDWAGNTKLLTSFQWGKWSDCEQEGFARFTETHDDRQSAQNRFPPCNYDRRGRKNFPYQGS